MATDQPVPGATDQPGASATGEVDLLAANIGDDRDPYPRYHEARRASPVAPAKHLGVPVTMVFSYDVASIVLRDEETFSARINGAWMRPLLGRTILEMDGREHFVHRKLIGHAFRPTVVKQWEETLIRPVAHEAIDRFAARGDAELVREFTWQVPVRVFAQILGVPAIDLERWQRWAVSLESAAVDWDRAVAAAKEAEAYFATVIEQRRAAPGDDVISDLVTAELDGQKLPEDLIHGFLRLLIPAGAATTYRLLGSMTLALLEQPSRLEAVRADRSLIAKAVEESLRWEAPVQFAMREATRDTELAGVAIAEGTPVFVNLGASNRDEARYDAPDAYDLSRTGPPPHVAFGDGVHRCLGEHLARLEAAVSLDVLLDRLPDLRLDADGRDPHVLGYAFRSPNCVPIRFSPS
ncbi:MAG TPA: cytochrome P450 [Actinomycetota bacterium]